MIKYVFSLFLLTLSVTVLAQKKSVVNLIQSTSSERIIISGKDVIKVYKGVFQQDFSVMRSDSAYFYVQENAFDAFGNVNITQGDTLNIFSDKLNYNGNTKIAILTNNVKMVDKDATLITNYLTYNTATRYGTYTSGGKLVNKDNTLTSKNGYYFAGSRDAFFKYDVVLVTPDALIKTDTLRYNTRERIAYFLGPTNIYDTKDKKDTLYTENGLYNTITEQAFFGKKNQYKQGTKRLKGDSLFYDRKIGFGRAVRNVVFTDSEQKITLTGDLANYYKAEERTLVTKDPYVVIVTEQKDTTTRDTVLATPPVKKDAKTVAKGTSPIKAPSLGTPAKPVLKTPPASPVKAPPLGTPIKTTAGVKADSTAKKDTITKAPERIKRDSIFISADTLETQMVTVKQWREMQEKARLAGIPDTTAKAKKPAAKAANQKPSKFITQVAPPIYVRDSTAKLLPLLFGKPDTIKKIVKVDKPKPGDTTKLARPGDTTKVNPSKTATGAPAKKKVIITEDDDPAFTVTATVLSDTARIRIVKAYHHAKLFKSDLQAKSDSMFYSYGDSTLKCYVQPLIWTKGSQLSGDTITIQMKNKKMDNMFMFPQAFIVNIEKEDSTHFNQMAGKRMRGFFKNDKLDKMFISGNAESIYFARDSTGKKIDGMERSLSSRMRIAFEDNSPKDIFWLIKPEQRYGPLEKFTEDERILKGFIWKPKERPISKESIKPSYGRKMAAAGKPAATAPAKKGAAGKPGLPLKAGEKAAVDTLLKKAAGGLNIKLGADSLSKKPLPAILPKADSTAVKPVVPRGTQRDTTAGKALPVTPKRD